MSQIIEKCLVVLKKFIQLQMFVLVMSSALIFVCFTLTYTHTSTPKIFTLKTLHTILRYIKSLKCHLLWKVFFLQPISVADVLSMIRNYKLYFFLCWKKVKSTWPVSSLLHIRYSNKDLTQSGKSCGTHVLGVCQETSIISIIWNKFETSHQYKLVQPH